MDVDDSPDKAASRAEARAWLGAHATARESTSVQHRARAEPDGDGWVLNGQKAWTSLAQHSEWAILLAGTNPSAPKDRGITYFLLDAPFNARHPVAR